MLKTLSDRLRDFSTGRIVIISLVVFLLFGALVLPGQASKAEQISGDSGSPDLSFYYTADDLVQMAAAYGEEGREEYVRARFTFDLVFPLVFAFFMITALSWLTRKIFSSDSSWQMANLIPVFGAVFDYLENISTSMVMARYPSSTDIVASLAGIFTSLKWIFVGVASILIIDFALWALWNKIAQRS